MPAKHLKHWVLTMVFMFELLLAPEILHSDPLLKHGKSDCAWDFSLHLHPNVERCWRKSSGKWQLFNSLAATFGSRLGILEHQLSADAMISQTRRKMWITLSISYGVLQASADNTHVRYNSELYLHFGLAVVPNFAFLSWHFSLPHVPHDHYTASTASEVCKPAPVSCVIHRAWNSRLKAGLCVTPDLKIQTVKSSSDQEWMVHAQLKCTPGQWVCFQVHSLFLKMVWSGTASINLKSSIWGKK